MASAASTNTKAVSNTPQAKNDNVSATEGSNNILIADLLANDLGGNGKSFHSLSSATSAKGASVVVDGAAIRYDGSNAAALQALAAGEKATDTFEYSIQLGNGVRSTATVTVEVTGVNDDAVIAGAPATGTATEDAGAKATGSIGFSDVDVADRHSISKVTSASGNLGALTASVATDTTNGAGGTIGWQYLVDNGAIQYLAEGEKKTETFTIELQDGHSTVTKQVAVDVVGVNDAARIASQSNIGGVDKGLVIEDTNIVNGKLTTGGVFTFTDADKIDTHSIKSVVLVSGDASLGALNATVQGDSTNGLTGEVRWAFEANNDHAAVQALDNGETLTQTYAVTLTDSKTGGDIVKNVTVEIAGKSDSTGVNFEDVYTNYGWAQLQDGYAGFNWDVRHDLYESGYDWYGSWNYHNVWSNQPEVIDTNYNYWWYGSGNVGEGSKVLYAWGYGDYSYADYDYGYGSYYYQRTSDDDLIIERSDGSDFTFDSAHVMALWNNDNTYGESVTLTGYNDGAVVGTQTFIFDQYGTSQLLDVAWGPIDRLEMDLSGGGFAIDQMMFG